LIASYQIFLLALLANLCRFIETHWVI